ncbi:MAG: hypothetical protein R3D03_19405 [Geminicoccaceae bacterium]
MSESEGPFIDAEEAACRLLLRWPGEAVLDGIGDLPSLAGLIAGEDGIAAAGRWLVGREAALFLDIDGPYDGRLAVDGALVDHDADIGAVRRHLGRDAIIGARCGMSRHAAMVAGENGADYTLTGHADGSAAIDEMEEFLVWWRELFVLPVAATGFGGVDEAERLVAAGADFLLPMPMATHDPVSARSLILSLDRMLGG